MGKFNSYDHFIYSCGQESITRNGGALIVSKKSPQCSPWAVTLVAQWVYSPPASAGDAHLIPGLGRSPGEGHGNPL